MPLHVGADLEPELEAAVAEHVRGCLNCARALRAHQATHEAYRGLRSTPFARSTRHSEADEPSLRGAAFWKELQARLHETKVPSSAELREVPSWKERYLILSERVSPRFKLALAAALLGTSLLALGLKLVSMSNGVGGASTSGGMAAEDGLLRARVDLNELEAAGVLSPMVAPPEAQRIESRANPAPRRVQFVSRTGPNSNY